MNTRKLPRIYTDSDDAWFDDETDPHMSWPCWADKDARVTDQDDDEPTLPRTNVRSFFAELADELEAAFKSDERKSA